MMPRTAANINQKRVSLVIGPLISQFEASGVKVPNKADASVKAREKQVVPICFGTISTGAPSIVPV
ncbi:hypothetical protein CQ10_24175 [Bradyrhizobium valentinum]|uniref:Uncharacterized protein n=1 Tax=Bradyrhizobium valentinum TaxID=1518501 RepID=A0A0R3LBD4_9BRAD|nr:hypothetical protein CQ10_24175 [Bradyrhizobium valentinum]KRR02144.1 hypothetical protein CP49_05080 [Bradyrhizobium valentinum]